MLLDIRTALLAGAGFMSVVTALLFVYRFTRKTYPGFLPWAASSALVVTGFVLFGLRGLAPDVLSVLVGSAALATAAVSRLLGTRLFLAQPRMSRAWWLAPAVVVAGVPALGLGPHAFAARAVLVSVAVALPAFATAVAFLRPGPSEERLLRRTTAGLLLALVALLGVRIASASALPRDLLVSTPAQAAVLVAMGLLESAWNVTFLMLNGARLESELRRALEDVRILEKLLPICAWCKKIRDDGGYWQQIETFLGEHANTRFTHGICPDCERKLRG